MENKNATISKKISKNTYEISKKESPEVFQLEMVISSTNLIFKCKRLKTPFSYENSLNYDSLLSTKQLKIYDNIQEIYDFFLQKLEKAELVISPKENEILIEFLIFYENKTIPVPINLSKNEKIDLNVVIFDLINRNTALEERVEVLEKKNSDFKKYLDLN